MGKEGALGLQVLIAGCPRDERSQVERTVRRAVGPRADHGAWSISLVRLGADWQVTIDGPEPLKGVSLTVPEIRLQSAIVEVVAKTPVPPAAAPGPTPASRPSRSPVGTSPSPAGRSPSVARPAAPPKPTPPPAAAGEARDQHECSKCGQGFVVVYAKQPGEGSTKAPVACPKCWQVMHVSIASEAAHHQDYRAEAV